MTSEVRSPVTIYTETASGQLVCGLCQGLDRQHAPDCAILALREQLKELTAQLGLFVATMRETMDAIDRLLRGEAV